jgi:CheY-like chemotaxis protein
VTTFLTKRGHSVVAVENGRDAVASIDTSGPFDVVLMDLQMPEMSGFEATAAIRDREKQSGGHLPIIALTAHAMQGDRERCLEAGMDGYLAKPIDVDELMTTIEHIHARPNDGKPEEPRQTASPTPDDVVFDQQAALAHTGGDRRLLKEIVALFRSDAPSYLERIGRALKRQDAEALRTAAHGLKGAIATVGSPAGRQAAADVEQAGRASQFEDAARAYARLLDHIKRLDDAFAAARLTGEPRGKVSSARRAKRNRS